MMGVTQLCRDEIKNYDDSNSRYRLGNNDIYDFVKKHFSNKNIDWIANKMWLIGRTYAAAVERFKKDEILKEDDFYYDHVAPFIADSELDSKINAIKKKGYKSPLDVGASEDILDLHMYLVNLLKELTNQEKRSLASKYLHFHLPSLVFIYDHITASNINKFIKKGTNKIPQHIGHSWDNEYAKLYYKAMEIYEIVSKNKYPSGDCFIRVVDNLLLRYKK